MIFFPIAFLLILFTKLMILSEYGISWQELALLWLAQCLSAKWSRSWLTNRPLSTNLSTLPLLYNTLWKSIIYFLAALLVRYPMHVVH